MNRQIVTLRITTNLDQIMSCGAFTGPMIPTDEWKKDMGKPIRVYLPPEDGKFHTYYGCPELKYEIAEREGIAGAEHAGDDGPIWICRHFLDMD